MASPFLVIIESQLSVSPKEGLLIETQIVAGKPIGQILLYPIDEDPNIDPDFGPPGPFSFYITPSGQTSSSSPTSVSIEGQPNVDVVAGDRLGIWIRPDGIGQYHRNFAGPTSQPLYVSGIPVKQDSLYRLRLQSSQSYDIFTTKSWWVRQRPEWRYTGISQRQDRGLASGDPLTGININSRVRQKSFYPLGTPSDWLYKEFIRP